MQRSHIVRPAAMFWGLVVFAPVGVPYLAAVLMIAALLYAGGLGVRAARLRANPLWWPIVAFVVWTLVVLALGPHYPETASNTFHGLRIAITMLIPLAFDRDEVLWAVRGFLIAAAVGLVITVLYHTIGFPVAELWRGTLMPVGNKSISNALLFTVFGATAAVFGLAHLRNAHGRLEWRAICAFALTAFTAVIAAVWLTSRTSMLALLISVLAICIHQWRRQLRTLSIVVVLLATVSAAMIWQAPSVQQKFELGMHELEAAQAGAVSEGSWVVRYYMYRDTARMIIDKPLAGWGIGGWTEQWHLRGPKLLADYNMPHNDFLWMGAQAGIPGSVTLLVILLTGVWCGWRRDDLAGRYGFAAMLIMLIATSVNSAMRDAQIGLSLLWVTMVYLRLAQEPGAVWRDVPPQRWRSALT